MRLVPVSGNPDSNLGLERPTTPLIDGMLIVDDMGASQ
jgi:hypothetical protein